MGWGFGGGGGGGGGSGTPWRPEGSSGDVGERVAILHEFSLTEEGIYALGKARLLSTPSIWSANVVFKTVPLFVSLSDGSIFWAL